MTQYHPWFERVYRKLGLPFWIGVIIIGLLPFVILRSLAFLLSPHGLDYSAIAYLVMWAVLILGSQYGTRHIVSTMDRLKEQTSTMGEIKPLDDSSVKRSLYTMILGGAFGIAFVAIWFPAIPGEPLLSHVVRPISVFYGGTSFLQFMLVYALASSAFRGTPSLKLKPFTEDLFMGLRPFGTAALHVAGTVSLLLSTIFFAFTSSLVLAIGNPPLYFVATQAM